MERPVREVVVVSGKGGTGKTSVTASLAYLFKNLVVVDADVDAANLHLVLPHTIRREMPYVGGEEPQLDREACTLCGNCIQACRFDAIKEGIVFDTAACEGCGACAWVCPTDAITMVKKESGKWFVSTSPYGPFIHARLKVGEENSGKLAAHIRGSARELAQDYDLDLILVDGPPGIGCPVISTISGSDYVVVVTEPTISGLHDMERVVDVIRHFKIPSGIVVNKSDLNEEMTRTILTTAEGKGMNFLGTIPYDPDVTTAIRLRKIPYEGTQLFRSSMDLLFDALVKTITKQ